MALINQYLDDACEEITQWVVENHSDVTVRLHTCNPTASGLEGYDPANQTPGNGTLLVAVEGSIMFAGPVEVIVRAVDNHTTYLWYTVSAREDDSVLLAGVLDQPVHVLAGRESSVVITSVKVGP